MENRYDKYKDSGIAWIGEIPEHWEICSIKQIMKNKSIKGFPNETVLSLYRDFGVIPKDSRDDNHNVTSEDTSNYKLVENGDFVINKMKAWQGSMAISDFKGIISPAYYICKIFNPKVVRKYIHYLLRDESYKAEYMRLSTGMRIGQWDLNIDDFLQINTILPSLSEQQSIATYLDQKCSEIDELITLQEEMITKLQSYKQSVITETVTKGLDKNIPLKDSGIEWIGEIPEHWNFRRIKTFSSVKRGASPRPIDDPKYFDDNGEFAWVRIADVSASDKYLEATTQKLSELGSSLSVKRYPGDIFISIAGTVGKPIISNIKCCIHDGFVYFPNMEGINVEYLYYIFLSGQPYLGLGKMGTQLNLNTETIGNIYIPSPNIVEQTKIVCFLCQKCSEIDALISIKQQKIEKLKDYKKSLIFECVTGKRKVS